MGDDCREPFFMARLLSVAALLSSIAIGQQQGMATPKHRDTAIYIRMYDTL